MPTPIHNHSHFSALDGLSKPHEIAERCEELGYGSCGLTDHDVVAGHIDFYKELDKKDIKPILGIEAYQTTGPRQTNKGFRTDPKSKERADNFHLILLAMNERGLRNLYAMNTAAHVEGFYYNSRVDWELLEKYNEGIICTSACGLSLLSQSLRDNPYAGDTPELVQKYLNIFGDRFFVEISTYREEWTRLLNTQLVGIAQEYSIPLVYANDAHYSFKGQYDLHETVLCMQYQEKVSQRTEPHHSPDLYIMDDKEIERSLGNLPMNVIYESIDNSDEIARKCNVVLPEHRKRIPVFVPDSKWSTTRDMLFDLATKGYEERIAKRKLPDDVYLPRFEEEMKVIFKANLVDYLLEVRDNIKWAERQGQLVGPGRGSIGGSLVAYCLGIHDVDPIKYGLIFERFYNIGREGSLPDIDVDFPTFGRDDVTEYVSEKYGSEYVAHIGTAGRLQGRAAIRALGRTLEIPYSDISAISGIIERAIQSGQQPKWQGDRGIYELVGNELAPFKKKHPKLFDYAEQLHDHISQYGVHASGVLVGDEPLAEVFPLRWHAKDKKPVTQWDMSTAEELGFMKQDFLGLRNLDTLMEFNKIREEQGNESVDFKSLVYEEESLPEDMWKLLDNGFTTGIFQIEDKPKPKQLCGEIHPRNLEDIALITALNRPGPLKSGSDYRYVRGRKGEEVHYRHPIFEAIASNTYGEIVYQEQFIRFFEELGYDKIEADKIRAIVGKKKREKMAEIKPDYIQRFADYSRELRFGGFLESQGSDTANLEILADEIWKDLENFADYAFNKAHSVEYGLISIWTLYAKWLDPQAFILASIRTLVRLGHKEQVPRFIREAKRMDIPVLPPDLNRSQIVASIDGDAIRYGFADVKGIGMSPAKWLVTNRPFADFDEVLERAQEDDRKLVLRSGVRIVGVKKDQIDKLKQLSEPMSVEQKMELEEELLGAPITYDPASILDEYAEEIAQECTPLDSVIEPGIYTVAGVINNIKHAKTRTGTPMAWVTIENNGVEKDFAVWNTELERLRFVWQKRTAVSAKVKVTSRGANILGAKALFSKKNSEVPYVVGKNNS